MTLSEENIQMLKKRKEELLNQPYNDINSRIVECIDILLEEQHG